MNYLLIKLVVVFFGPAAGVAEFIVSFRTFFSGCICTNKKMLKLSNKLLDGYKLSRIVRSFLFFRSNMKSDKSSNHEDIYNFHLGFGRRVKKISKI